MARPTILVVDDDLADLLRDLLEAEGYQVHAVNDGSSACRTLEQNRPALVITDVAHPGPDGYALIAACQTYAPRIPTILLSAGGHNACPAGTTCLAKPFDLEQFCIVVSRLLAHRSALKT